MISFILFSIIIYVFLSNPTLIIDSVNNSINLFIKNIFPTLFPFFILTDILNNYNYFKNFNKLIKFKYTNIILISLISGLPSNAKNINDMLDKNEIDITDASRLLSFTYFPNPMFVIGTIGALMLNNIKIGIILLITTYLSNFALYFINYRKLKPIKLQITKNKEHFITLIKTSILNNISNLLVILGTMIIFNLLINIIKSYISVNNIILSIINVVLELTSGINSAVSLNINIFSKALLIGFALSISSLSVIFQSISILNKYNLNYKIIIKNKILIVLINILLNIIFLNIINI